MKLRTSDPAAVADLNQGILAQRHMLAEITDLIEECRNRVKKGTISDLDVARFDAAMVGVWQVFNDHALHLWVLGEYTGSTMSPEAASSMHERLLREQASEIHRMLYQYPGTSKMGTHGR